MLKSCRNPWATHKGPPFPCTDPECNPGFDRADQLEQHICQRFVKAVHKARDSTLIVSGSQAHHDRSLQAASIFNTEHSFIPNPPPRGFPYGLVATSPGLFDVPLLFPDDSSNNSAFSTPNISPPREDHIPATSLHAVKPSHDDGFGLDSASSYLERLLYPEYYVDTQNSSIHCDAHDDCNSISSPSYAEKPTCDDMPVDSALEDDTLVPVLPTLQESGHGSLGSPEVPQTQTTVSGCVEGTRDVSSHQKTKSSNATNASPGPLYHNGSPVLKTPSLYDPSQSSTSPDTEILTIGDSDFSATPSTDSTNSGSGTPVKAESPYSEPPTSSILGEKGIRMLDELGGLFAKTIFQRFGFRQCLGAAQSENCGQGAGATGGQDHGQGSGQSGQTAKRKRGDDADDQGSASGNGQGGKDPSQKRTKMEASVRQKIACPYMKRYPVEFSTWRTCPGPGFDGMHRMKYV